ncbi:UPF0182 family protein [Litorilinea aerophila]|uniref:UPF0182 protein FKZ61_18400 n=1 Tax=Litorilinea aerophila TaxID=1204385 RepID=A0A540VD92_9CHLR|nr:UPF0182 family protein [Litorilinea aerophila]MCC9078094.1 UPF0182 family protein [Litorilinea aerophila]
MRQNDPFADLIRSIEENLQGEGDWIPPESERRAAGSQGNPRRILWFLLPLLLLIFFNRIVGFYTDWYWYESLGFERVFVTRFLASFGLFLAGALFFWIFLALNVLLARRLAPAGLANTALDQIANALGIRITSIILGGGVLLALILGGSLSSHWEELLLYLNQAPFQVTDPVFNRDVGFFIFTLPIWQLARNWLMSVIVITLLATAFVAGVGWRTWRVRTPVLAHLSVLGALILLLIAWQYRLDAYQLVYSTRGAVFGAGYTDVKAQLPAYNILSIVTLVTAVLLVVTVYLRQAWRAIVAVLVIWVAVAILAGNFYPGLVQRFQVSPNELNLERPYIENNIQFTRLAYDLDRIEVRSYDASNQLTAESLLAEPQTVRNIRLWDYRPLLQTYNQIQALRQYYEFNDIDIDRYTIEGERRQVMLAARELVPERLNQNAQTWVNRKLVYTHGYGVAASPVAQVTRDGLPEFLLKDLPPQGAIPITQPQIYFGELTNDYVIVRTTEPEFDFPREGENVTTRFTADTGIAMTFWKRLLFAVRFADINILLNQDIQPDSQLLWRRNILERIQEVAPFLRYDQDPYIVIGEDGRLYWMLDAYTVSDRFPYSEPFGSINYIRNPVKVVTNAYDGTMAFYVMDENEPITAAYRQIFPDLFRPLSAIPAGLQAHIRYPVGLFSVQAEMYRTYHMTDVNQFYNKEDVWAWPEEIFADQPQRIEPYYVLMQLPGSNDLDFVLILPFTPANRENMIAWMAVQNDPGKYGQQLVYEFGKDTLFYGPKQIEARIDQDPVISAQLSLWNQQGSDVIRGNLLVIPINNSLLYVEPLYLQAANGKIPELKRVILATADRVVMAENLGLALVELFGRDVLADSAVAELAASTGSPLPGESSGAVDGGSPAAGSTGSVAELIRQANEHFQRAQDYLRDGNWAGYGAEMDALQAVLEQLAALTGVNPAEPAATTP